MQDSMFSLQSADYDKFDQRRNMTGAQLRKSSSCPDLSMKKSAPQLTNMSPIQQLRLAGIDTVQERQPDHLLKEFLKILSNPKHPWTRRLDCFPVLARIPKG